MIVKLYKIDIKRQHYPIMNSILFTKSLTNRFTKVDEYTIRKVQRRSQDAEPERAKESVTIDQVAAQGGVSRPTVPVIQMVVRCSSSETRERVEEVNRPAALPAQTDGQSLKDRTAGCWGPG